MVAYPSNPVERPRGSPADGAVMPPSCPVCDTVMDPLRPAANGLALVVCPACATQGQVRLPGQDDLAALYDGGYFLDAGDPDLAGPAEAGKDATAQRLLASRGDAPSLAGRRVLEIGSGQGNLLRAAARAGATVTGIEPSPAARLARERTPGATVLEADPATVALQPRGYDVCVAADVIEHVPDPVAFLRRIHDALEPGGELILTTPNSRSLFARFLGPGWFEYKQEHLWYFSDENVRLLLIRTGFGEIRVTRQVKVLSFDYLAAHFARYPVPVLSGVAGLLRRVLPASLRRALLALPSGGMVVAARSAPPPALRPKLSIVMPAYNEAATVAQVIEAVLAVPLPGIDRELIIVESNSTDGTRAEVLAWSSHPDVRVVLEDRPRGKGHAVRAGLAQASGDIVLIQDADLEYDVADYPRLLAPLLRYQTAFVLGSRHEGAGWTTRRFDDRPALGVALNVGHVFFATLLNVLYGQRLSDPFTMYKVFRRRALDGLEFECDRFDFDFELVLKLVRAGYRPLEVPVSYASRSFGEGKKVSILRDPPTWIRALLRYRFS